jgi:hypothetical protein
MLSNQQAQDNGERLRVQDSKELEIRLETVVLVLSWPVLPLAMCRGFLVVAPPREAVAAVRCDDGAS